jgi:hypothetical protein
LPAKVALVAVMRRLRILANALIRDDREWAANKAMTTSPKLSRFLAGRRGMGAGSSTSVPGP